MYTDTVTLAGVVAQAQYFGAVTQVGDTFAEDLEDGILGLAYQSISNLDQPPYFNTVGLASRQWALLTRTAACTAKCCVATRFQLPARESRLGIVPRRCKSEQVSLYHDVRGSIHTPARYQEPITWYDVVSQSYWVITASVNINGKGLKGGKTFKAIIDSGTTIIVAPVKEARAFWNSVPGARPFNDDPSYHTFPCASPPQVSPSIDS